MLKAKEFRLGTVFSFPLASECEKIIEESWSRKSYNSNINNNNNNNNNNEKKKKKKKNK